MREVVITVGHADDRSAAGASPLATKADLAYGRVRELILTGELEPGAVINQATLRADRHQHHARSARRCAG